MILYALITVLMKECHRWSCNERNLVANNVLGNYTKRKSNHQRDNISMSNGMYLLIADSGKNKMV